MTTLMKLRRFLKMLLSALSIDVVSGADYPPFRKRLRRPTIEAPVISRALIAKTLAMHGETGGVPPLFRVHLSERDYPSWGYEGQAQNLVRYLQEQLRNELLMGNIPASPAARIILVRNPAVMPNEARVDCPGCEGEIGEETAWRVYAESPANPPKTVEVLPEYEAPLGPGLLESSLESGLGRLARSRIVAATDSSIRSLLRLDIFPSRQATLKAHSLGDKAIAALEQNLRPLVEGSLIVAPDRYIVLVPIEDAELLDEGLEGALARQLCGHADARGYSMARAPRFSFVQHATLRSGQSAVVVADEQGALELRLSIKDEDGRELLEMEPGSRVEVGRSTGNEIVFEGNATISAHHLTIRLDFDGCVVLTDRSQNGTFVNGRRVEGTLQLKERRQQIRIGPESNAEYLDLELMLERPAVAQGA